MYQKINITINPNPLGYYDLALGFAEADLRRRKEKDKAVKSVLLIQNGLLRIASKGNKPRLCLCREQGNSTEEASSLKCKAETSAKDAG